MAIPANKHTTPELYLQMEVNADEKHEFFDGEVVAMAGASESHNRIVANLIGEIHSHLKGKDCDVFPSDMRVTTPLLSSYMYPDISIVCGDIEKQPGQFDTLLNPSVIIEVMSPSTKERDMGVKFWYYLQIPSLKEYILVDAQTYNVKKIIRQQDGSFLTSDIAGMDKNLIIDSINIQLPIADIYRKVIL